MSQTIELSWVHRGFEAFSRGAFDNGGDNLYVNAKGIIEMIHRFDVDNDGHVDIIFPNAHGYLERGPTWIYTQPSDKNEVWPRQTLPNVSGWMSRAVDVDGDGVYSPLPIGPDHPEFVGDQVMWYVANDGAPGSHGLFGTLPLGIEVQFTTFGFDRPDVFGDMMFVKGLEINKGGKISDEMAQWWWDRY